MCLVYMCPHVHMCACACVLVSIICTLKDVTMFTSTGGNKQSPPTMSGEHHMSYFNNAY